MRIENVPISDIAVDIPGWDQFVFTYPLVPGRLAASIQSIGLQQPITVAAVDNRCYVVLGVKRLLACRELDHHEIPAVIRRTDDTEDLLRLSLQEKITVAPLNPIEKARVITRFGNLWQNDLESLQQKICPLLDLPPTVDSIDTHLFFSRLPEWLQLKLATGELSPAHLALLSSFRHDDIDAVGRAIFVRCQPSLQEAREMIENLSALCARDDLRPSQILVTGEIAGLLSEQSVTARERTAKLRQWLHRTRFPRFSAAEESFRNLVAPLEKRAGISIQPPRGFEGAACQARFQIADEKEVEKAVAALTKSLADETWKKIFDLLRNGSLTE